MKTVYFVRHGEAANNVMREPGSAEWHAVTYQGALAPLTDLGRQQALLIAERAAQLPIEAIVASTMLRAQDTAKTISARVGLSVDSSDLFTERVNPTSFIGRKWNDGETQDLEKAWVRTFFETGTKYEDGENFEEMLDRAHRALRFLEERSESNLLVVTHGFYLHMLIGLMLLGESLTAPLFKRLALTMRTKNTGLTVAFCDSGSAEHPVSPAKWSLVTWNDHAHLG